ncbi:MAG TPA: YbaN family protein [Eoetvoesiella sp.]
MKILLNILGTVALALAILGIFLPLLPTTPFLLLASACYLRGSRRMHRWLVSNRVFGEYLNNIQNNRGIPLRGKILALLFLWLSLAYSAYAMPLLWVQVLLLIPGIGVTVYLLRMKTLTTPPPKQFD